MSNVCPAGHFSTDSDYCSECGKPMRAAASALAAASTDPSRGSPAVPSGASGSAPGASICPDCGTPRAATSRYCEVCRYDFPAGQSFTGLSSVSAPSPVLAAAPAPLVVAVEPGAPGGLPARAETETEAGRPDAGRSVEGSRRLLLRIVVDESLNTEPDPATPCPTDSPARVYHLDLPENTLGRQYEAHGISPEIVVNDPGISRRHVKFVRTAQGAYDVLELGSANGTKLNAVALQTGVAVRVEPGDQLTLGMWTRIHVEARQAS